jgi:arabinogalactan endo-1,4-beta-galactosidase
MYRKITLLLFVVASLAILFVPYTQATDTMSQPYYVGVDLSYVNEMLDCGAEYRVNGELRDPYEIFSEAGANLVRVRLWNNPTWTEYSNLEDVKLTLSRAREQGMDLLLDFHYSDTWADPGKQIIPAAWADYIDDPVALSEALYQYTFDTLMELDSEGLMPNIVQVGNEINTEMLRAEDDDGYPIRWERNALMLNTAIQAVHDAGAQSDISPKVMLHVAQPHFVEGWMLAATEAGVTGYDIIGMSYYPKWTDFSINATGRLVNQLRHQFNADVMVVETAYLYTLDGVFETADNIPDAEFMVDGYSPTPAGQKQFMVDLTQSVLSNGGLGVIYWEPAWVSTDCSTLWGQGSHWENATFFDFRDDNNAQEGIEFLSYPYELPVAVTLDVASDADELLFWGDFTGSGRRMQVMEQVEDGVFRFSTSLMPGTAIRYGFFTSTNRNEGSEVFSETCDEDERTFTVGESAVRLEHSFGQCGATVSVEASD